MASSIINSASSVLNASNIQNTSQTQSVSDLLNTISNPIALPNTNSSSTNLDAFMKTLGNNTGVDFSTTQNFDLNKIIQDITGNTNFDLNIWLKESNVIQGDVDTWLKNNGNTNLTDLLKIPSLKTDDSSTIAKAAVMPITTPVNTDKDSISTDKVSKYKKPTVIDKGASIEPWQKEVNLLPVAKPKKDNVVGIEPWQRGNKDGMVGIEPWQTGNKPNKTPVKPKDGEVGIEPWQRGNKDGIVGIEPWQTGNKPNKTPVKLKDGEVGIEPWQRGNKDGMVGIEPWQRGNKDGMVGIEPWQTGNNPNKTPVKLKDGEVGIEPWLMGSRISAPPTNNQTTTDSKLESATDLLFLLQILDKFNKETNGQPTEEQISNLVKSLDSFIVEQDKKRTAEVTKGEVNAFASNSSI